MDGFAVQAAWRVAEVFSAHTGHPLPQNVLLSGSHRSEAVCVHTQHCESRAPQKG